MLNFAEKPSRKFHRLVLTSLKHMDDYVDFLNTENLEPCFQSDPSDYLHECMTLLGLSPLQLQIRHLIHYHKQTDLIFQISEVHWLILYEALVSYIEYQNMLAEDHQPADGGKVYKEISFDEYVLPYFWDLDFQDLPQFFEEHKEFFSDDAQAFERTVLLREMGVDPQAFEDLQAMMKGTWDPFRHIKVRQVGRSKLDGG